MARQEHELELLLIDDTGRPTPRDGVVLAARADGQNDLQTELARFDLALDPLSMALDDAPQAMVRAHIDATRRAIARADPPMTALSIGTHPTPTLDDVRTDAMSGRPDSRCCSRCCARTRRSPTTCTSCSAPSWRPSHPPVRTPHAAGPAGHRPRLAPRRHRRDRRRPAERRHAGSDAPAAPARPRGRHRPAQHDRRETSVTIIATPSPEALAFSVEGLRRFLAAPDPSTTRSWTDVTLLSRMRRIEVEPSVRMRLGGELDDEFLIITAGTVRVIPPGTSRMMTRTVAAARAYGPT